MLCEMERGALSWEDSDCIDRIHRAHAQKHIVGNKSVWSRTSEPSRKPWFCKGYQSGNCTHSKDHESNGKLQKHICMFCLSIGKQLGHPEKDCIQKKNVAKNE